MPKCQLLFAFLTAALLAACGDRSVPDTIVPGPQPITTADECHLCGMVIARFPGPKGEVADRQGKIHKFCSTRDLLAWMLQPENRNQVAAFYVHDMARSDWNRPDDAHMIDGRGAWYVTGSTMKGAMGPTLASFADEAAARAFAQKHGGHVVRFADITLETLNTLADAPHSHGEMASMPDMAH